MCKNILFLSREGLCITTNKTTVLLDYENSKKTPDAIFFSNPHSAYSCLHSREQLEYIPYYTEIQTKKLMKKISNADDSFINNITECLDNKTYRLRKNQEVICEFAFYNYKTIPWQSEILITTNKKSILYIKGEVPDIKALPHHDIMVINCNKKAPLYPMLKNLPSFVVQINDFSRMWEILDFFNKYGADNSVAIDNSALPAACEYLKMDFTVFSKIIKPLSAYKTNPRIVITSLPHLYCSRPCIPDYAFSSGMSLSDIYSIASYSPAQHIFAFCPHACSRRTRGNLTICSHEIFTEI